MPKPTVYILTTSEETALNLIFDATLSTTEVDEAKRVAKKTGNDIFAVTLTKVEK